LKISSTHATNDVDNPGKNQSKRKIPRPNSKATLEHVVRNVGLPEENQSNDTTGYMSNTEKNQLEGVIYNAISAPTNVSQEDVDNENADSDDDFSKSLFAKPEIFFTKVVDVVIQIHMVEIALFLYGDKTTVVGQPLVNHRPLYVSNMKSRDFLEKMQSKNHDFGEEMHATVYEVRKKTNNEDNPIAIPVYAAYVTSDDDLTGHELTDIVAVYASVEGLKKLVSTVGLQMQVKDNKPRTIIEIFKQIATTCNFAINLVLIRSI
jgi:hypothetical protein